MSMEQYLSHQLQKFSLLDIALVKIVYLLCGVLVALNYSPLLQVGWLFYLIMMLISAIPLLLHFFSIPGSYLQKAKHYLGSNKPAYQVLLFFTMFFLGCLLSTVMPFLQVIPWWGG
ncbi:hypothetical protein [Facilibium subflavum]|uniref:hypothetical protein n=1 Tax=Facilibium subflavum TaxID=2219058 RepID=UPI0013C35070|nr:hypothetical protein [Facilibium subflavum]